MIDKISADRIAKLHPKIRTAVTLTLEEANLKLTGRAQARISQGLRTFAEQDALFAQRPKVTNAKGGASIHNYGLAIDIVLIIDGKTADWDTKADWDGDKQSDWMEVVAIFKKHGFSWGGDWRTFKDMPHFEMNFGFTWQQLLAKYKNKQFIDATSYVNI